MQLSAKFCGRRARSLAASLYMPFRLESARPPSTLPPTSSILANAAISFRDTRFVRPSVRRPCGRGRMVQSYIVLRLVESAVRLPRRRGLLQKTISPPVGRRVAPKANGDFRRILNMACVRSFVLLLKGLYHHMRVTSSTPPLTK